MSRLDDLQIDAPVPRPRRRQHFPWLPVVVLIFIVAVTLWQQRDRLSRFVSDSPVNAASQTEAVTPLIQVASSGPVGSISAAGYLEVIPPGPTIVSALVAGKVDELSVVAGQTVAAGDVIARLDAGMLQRQADVLASRVELARRRLEREQAGFRTEEIKQAEAVLASAEARLSQASADWERGQWLFSQGVAARQDLDAERAAWEQAQASVDETSARLSLLIAGTRSEDIRIAEGELSAAQAELSAVGWEIAQCTITAPVAGTVLEQFALLGGWVAPGTDNPQSAALMSIFDPSQVQAWVDINQRDSTALFVGQQVELSTDSQPGRKVKGVVSRIMPQANLQKNTVQVKISIESPPEDFRPELSIKAVFLPRENQGSDKPAAQAPPATHQLTEEV